MIFDGIRAATQGMSREGKNEFKELQPNSFLQRLRERRLVALKGAFIIATSSSNEMAKAGLTCGGACTSRSGGPPSSGTPRRSCTARRTPRAPGTPAKEANTRVQVLLSTQQNESSSRSCLTASQVTQRQCTNFNEFVPTPVQKLAKNRKYWGPSLEVTPSVGRSHAMNHGHSRAPARSPDGFPPPAPVCQKPSRPPCPAVLPW